MDVDWPTWHTLGQVAAITLGVMIALFLIWASVTASDFPLKRSR